MPIVSDVLIGRLALSHIGARSTIESFAEESAEAKQVELWYDFSRKQTLEAFDWNFARKRLTLAAHGDAPPEGHWAFRYQYPADCIKARQLENPVVPAPNTGIFPTGLYGSLIGAGADAVPFEVEISADGTKSILTNLDEARLIYTFDLMNPTLFSALFIEALSRNLASRIAFPLTGKRSIAEDQIKLFLLLVSRAETQNANERVDAPPRDAEWVRGR